MSGDHLTSFAELADILARMPQLVRDTRRARGQTLAEAGALCGANASTLLRVEQGKTCSLDNAVGILRWLDQRPESRGFVDVYAERLAEEQTGG